MKRPFFCFVILLSIFSGACTKDFSTEAATGDLPKIQEGYEGCDDDLAPVVTEQWRPIFKLHFEKHQEINHSGTFSADGRLFAVTLRTRKYDPTMTFVYDLVEKKNIAWIVNKNRLPSIRVIPVALSTDNKYLVFCDVNDLVAWNLQENEEERRFAFPKTLLKHHSMSGGDESYGPVSEQATAITSIEFLDDNTKIRAHLKDGYRVDNPMKKDVMEKYEKFHFLWDFHTGKPIGIPGQSKNPVIPHSSIDFARCPRTNVKSGDQRIQVNKIDISHDIKRLEWTDHRAQITGAVPLEFCRESKFYYGNIYEFLFLPESHMFMTVTNPADPVENLSRENANAIPTAKARTVPKTENPSQALIEFWDCDHYIWDMHQVNMFPKKIRTVYFEGEEILFSGVPDSQGKRIFFQAGKRKDQFSQENLHGYIFSLDFDAEPGETQELFLNYEFKVTLPEHK